MSDKLNCFECKNWFDVNELIYLPTEQYYLCHHDAATHYAIKCENLRAERDEARAVVEAAREYVDLNLSDEYCPNCLHRISDGHDDGCELAELAAALERVKGKSEK